MKPHRNRIRFSVIAYPAPVAVAVTGCRSSIGDS